ncbi:unnamed protein product [Acanthoscelides obtectus]|uniref:Guanylate cyclase n=1 Tax=Acanthoscelides obtectus TaxID=200917 RepID=A0A9P0K5N2_ACAOB|nr:unnamed protein product [Acanthoscelides obtectus]CAK1622791.1 hypothetical protein AOBTE_LOCUS1670 [Acanthoscelides obtectus]
MKIAGIRVEKDVPQLKEDTTRFCYLCPRRKNRKVEESCNTCQMPICPEHTTHTVEISSGVAGGVFIVVLVISLVLYRNWRYEQELDSLLWKIDFKDIQMSEENSNNQSMKSRTTTHPLIRTSQVSLSSNPDADFRYTTIYTHIGVFKGRIFAIKKVNKKSIDITREMKKELKLMRDLRHDNLNSFIGACTDPPNICIVTEYCARGSLKDILENEDVKLDQMFIASLVGDIMRGMIYLHESALKFHGALNPSNCLVDSRWVVKLSDFGLREFKKGSEDYIMNDPVKIKEKCHALLYRAPELLRIQDSFLTKEQVFGTQKGDVYSFSIILYELHCRKCPFGDAKLSAAEILNKVVRPCDPPFRPSLEALENGSDFVKECLKECWAENPEERPDFKSIRTKLRPLRRGMKPNILDNMMAMMEKYANNLEVLVDERTDQLQEEKKKTEALLYEMLPKPVADQLKLGNKVEAENFESVTIYFSDIVGFTAMSAESTPLQVVDFLNDLYTCFDSIIEHYDVYKVETIGDAYMVVSGLPIKNDIHAAEIATMSLHLLSEVKNFVIRHRPAEKVKLRIGIHSGPVCAGVVGLKMPRYCLFGDTVNTASRMESTGIPSKIHCSLPCRDLLVKLGGYHLVERGVVSLKGKGDQRTYWLVGEEARARAERREARSRRRAGLATNEEETGANGELGGSRLKNRGGGVGRSSLKIHGRKISRWNSVESPKKLRFASGENLEITPSATCPPLRPQTPPKFYLYTPTHQHVCCRPASTSCPCIENLANSAATLARTFLEEEGGSNSVPTLCYKLSVPFHHAVSAPASPGGHGLELGGVTEDLEAGPWAECTPLLKVTKPRDPESCV